MRRVQALFTFVLIVVSAAPAFSQVDDKQFLEQERRREMEQSFDKPAPESQDFLWDFGGWYHFEFMQFGDQPFNDSRGLRFHDVRLWAQADIDKTYHIFARVRSTYTDFNDGDQISGDDNDFNFFHLDQGFVEAPFNEMARSAFGPNSVFGVRAGRQLFTVGTGLLLNNIQDGLTLKLTSGLVEAKLFASRAIPSDDELDRSRPDPDTTRRIFVGAEVDYRIDGSHKPYGVLLLQKDQKDDEFLGQGFDYNSVYLAVGSRGNIAAGLGYTSEIDYEMGTSMGVGTNSEEDISALAFQVNLECYARVEMSPVFFFSYLFGSGDNNRASPTDTAAGNKPGTSDRGFLAFGYIPTGYALSPRVSNIHIVRLGFILKPGEGTDWGKDFDAGGGFYLYRKAKSAELISDVRSTEDNIDVGRAFDLFLRYKALSDFSMSLNYGVFFPGDAYLTKERREFLSVGMTYSF